MTKKTLHFRNGTVLVTEENGVIKEFWYNKEGKEHRDNGLPARVFSNGYTSYHQNGIRFPDYYIKEYA